MYIHSTQRVNLKRSWRAGFPPFSLTNNVFPISLAEIASIEHVSEITASRRTLDPPDESASGKGKETRNKRKKEKKGKKKRVQTFFFFLYKIKIAI